MCEQVRSEAVVRVSALHFDDVCVCVNADIQKVVRDVWRACFYAEHKMKTCLMLHTSNTRMRRE